MRRNNIDIFAEILKLAGNGGVKKTHIVYGANLNFNIVKKYLSKLLSNELLIFMEEERVYLTTDKGTAFLQKYSNVQPMMQALQV